MTVSVLFYVITVEPEPIPGPPRGGAGPVQQQITVPDFPEDYNALLELGNEQMDMERYTIAAEAYKRALAIDPSSVNLRTDFGTCLYGMGLLESAVKEYMLVLETDPSHAIVHYNLATVYHDLNQIDSARGYWTKYLEIEPEGMAADNSRAFLKQLEGIF